LLNGKTLPKIELIGGYFFFRMIHNIMGAPKRALIVEIGRE
jgi:hypothetical protein